MFYVNFRFHYDVALEWAELIKLNMHKTNCDVQVCPADIMLEDAKIFVVW